MLHDPAERVDPRDRVGAALALAVVLLRPVVVDDILQHLQLHQRVLGLQLGLPGVGGLYCAPVDLGIPGISLGPPPQHDRVLQVIADLDDNGGRVRVARAGEKALA